jgi:hypothetical protein
VVTILGDELTQGTGMTTVPPGGEPAHDTHRFVCAGCHTRFTSVRQCPVCGSPVVPLAELPLVPDRSMRPPAPKLHELSAGAALLAAALAIGLGWGEPVLWGVVPCVAITLALVFAPIARWEHKEAADVLAAHVRATPADGHPLQDGAARAATAVTSTRRPVGCAGLAFGVVFPLVMIRPEHPATVASGILAVVAFVLAWIRRVRRESEASAGRGVPM